MQQKMSQPQWNQLVRTGRSDLPEPYSYTIFAFNCSDGTGDYWLRSTIDKAIKLADTIFSKTPEISNWGPARVYSTTDLYRNIRRILYTGKNKHA